MLYDRHSSVSNEHKPYPHGVRGLWLLFKSQMPFTPFCCLTVHLTHSCFLPPAETFTPEHVFNLLYSMCAITICCLQCYLNLVINATLKLQISQNPSAKGPVWLHLIPVLHELPMSSHYQLRCKLQFISVNHLN